MSKDSKQKYHMNNDVVDFLSKVSKPSGHSADTYIDRTENKKPSPKKRQTVKEKSRNTTSSTDNDTIVQKRRSTAKRSLSKPTETRPFTKGNTSEQTEAKTAARTNSVPKKEAAARPVSETKPTRPVIQKQANSSAAKVKTPAETSNIKTKPINSGIRNRAAARPPSETKPTRPVTPKHAGSSASKVKTSAETSKIKNKTVNSGIKNRTTTRPVSEAKPTRPVKQRHATPSASRSKAPSETSDTKTKPVNSGIRNRAAARPPSETKPIRPATPRHANPSVARAKTPSETSDTKTKPVNSGIRNRAAARPPSETKPTRPVTPKQANSSAARAKVASETSSTKTKPENSGIRNSAAARPVSETKPTRPVTPKNADSSVARVKTPAASLDTQTKPTVTSSYLNSENSIKKDSEIFKDNAEKPSMVKTINDLLITIDTEEDKSKNKKAKIFSKATVKKIPSNIKDLFVMENPNYDPDAGKYISINGKSKKNKPTKISFKKTIRNILVMILAVIIIFTIYAATVIAMAPAIDPANIYDSISETSTIYDEDGNVIEDINNGQDRTIVEYKDLPDDLVNAVVALEDKTFWTHNGFNWIRMAGAVKSAVFSGGSVSGTSTITQQLARNVYLPDVKSQRSLKRKIIEMYYAKEIEDSLSKKEIIAAYLNTIYLGFGNYGVESASESYFSKPVSDLTLEECASLAVLPQAPDTYALVQLADSSTVSSDSSNIITRTPDTYVCNDVAKSRRQTCLKLMLEQDYITEDEYNNTVDLDLIDFINPTISTSSDNDYSYFTDYMIGTVAEDLMDELDITYDEATRKIYTGGLKIYSTMNTTAQDTVEKEFSDASNFPTVVDVDKDDDGNIITSSGAIKLYSYSNFFNDNGTFTIDKTEYEEKSDGSIVIKKGHRLNIYTTESDGNTDYSLEFKQCYAETDGTYYLYPGGYINIPSEYKSLDESGNLVIDSSFFKNNDTFTISDNTLTITKDAYTLNSKVIQPQAAMVITEVGNGEIKAMVGGRDTEGAQLFNRATSSRQPGSSIKPLGVYSAALQKSFEYEAKGQTFQYTDFNNDTQGTKYYGDYLTAASVIIDEPMTFSGETWPTNSYSGYHGAMTMREGLQDSVNVVAVKIHEQIGASYAADTIEKFGITTLVTDGDSKDMHPAALALGGLINGIKPLEIVQAYAAFPNGGVTQSSIFYTKVLDREGNTLVKSKSTATKVIDEGVAFIMVDMLKDVVSGGTGVGAALSGIAAAGKTGTTSDNYDIWFDGFTPSYAAVIWIGCDVNMKLSTESGAAASLWGKIMNQIPAALTGKYKSMPDDVVKKNGEYFTTGTDTGLSTYNDQFTVTTDIEEANLKEAAKKEAAEKEAAEKEAAEKEAAEKEAAEKEANDNADNPVDPVDGDDNDDGDDL